MLRTRLCQAVFPGPSLLSAGRRALLQARAPPARLAPGLLVVCISGQDISRKSPGSVGPRNAPKPSDVGSSDSQLHAKPENPNPWGWIGLIGLGAAVVCLFHVKPLLVAMLVRDSTKGALALSTAAIASVKDVPIKFIVGTGIGFACLTFLVYKMKRDLQNLSNKLDKVYAASMNDFEAYRVESRHLTQELCSEIKRNREEEQEFRESLETIKKTAFLEGQMAAKRRT